MDAAAGFGTHHPAPSTGPGGPPLRLAVGLGNPDLERRLLPVLTEAHGVVVSERCLAADQLLASLRRGQVDAVLLGHDLLGLGAAVAEIARLGLPTVLLAPAPVEPRWQALRALVLPHEADAATVGRALDAAAAGERPAPAPAETRPAVPTTEDRPAGTPAVLALASGHGSPGRTTLAVNLAAALGAVAPTVLVDLDVSGPSVAAYLDADPTRNFYLIAHRAPATGPEWERAVARETQPLGAPSPHAAVLCGLPSVEMRTALAPAFVDRLVAELRQRFRYVVLDVGAELLGADVWPHRAALALADRVLLAATPDLVGLHHARAALGLLHSHLALPEERVRLVLNRYDRRAHWGRDEVAWHLGAPVAAVVPLDHGAAQRALAEQRPLVYDRRSRAGRALLELAGRVHGGVVAPAPEPVAAGAPAGRLGGALRRLWPRRAAATTEGGRPDGRDAIAHA